MNIRKALTTTLATSALLLGGLTPAFAADVSVVGNGAGSLNLVNVSSNHEMSVSQTNNTSASNFVVANATTGGNTSLGNTGGSSFVTSGAANANVGISNGGSSNVLTSSGCGCESMGTSVFVGGNGAGSYNSVSANENHRMTQSQTNNTQFTNTVVTNAETGGNTSFANTGGTSSWNPFMSQNNWMTTWNSDMNSWMNQNGWMWIDGKWKYLGFNLNTGGSTNVTSGPASTTVGIINGGNTNVMH